MRGARGLAGGGAGVVAVYHVVVAVIGVPLIRTPLGVVGQLVLGVLDVAVLGAELLAELRSTGRADLDALAAGDALFLIDVRDICAAGHVGRIEKLGGAQRVADAGRAVANGEYLIFAVDIGYLVDIALILGALKYCHSLIIGDELAVLLGLVTVNGGVADSDAPQILNIARAFAAHTLGAAAGADADCELVILLQPVGQMLDADRLGAGGDGFLDGNDVHADACAAEGNHGRDLFKRESRHGVKEVAHLGVLVNEFLAHVEELSRAGNEEGQYVLLDMRVVLPVPFDKADNAHLMELLFERVQIRPAGGLGNILKRHGGALLHAQGDADHIVIKHLGKPPVFRAALVQLFKAELVGDAVGHLLTELIKIFFICHHLGNILLIKNSDTLIRQYNNIPCVRSHAFLCFGEQFVQLTLFCKILG